ncbi:ATP-binding protein [Bradyrhizobium sp. 1]|uniref:sensor histidine kinase n=1 Tax=Bradyrhizobium sp. 1 TaxID=241591 RepID=UPI001FFB7D24|nr:ATP-binding protein [Bradyrhizobium sp. 1]MCK1392456.1 ATP-binding protein [Bradyrhizobium sp. 1]
MKSLLRVDFENGLGSLVRTVKPCNANSLTRPSITEHLFVSEAISDGLDREDLLFAVRPLRGGFTYEGINHAFEAVLGMSSREVSGMGISDCMGRGNSESVCEGLEACLAEQTEVRIHHSLTFGGLRRDVETIVVPILDPIAGVIVRLIGRHRIFPEEFPDDGADEADNVRSSVDLASIQEDIHQRIASELHDSTCQYLIAASLGMMRIRTCLGTADGLDRICDDVDASIDQALREIRSLTYLLHPQNLMAQGLKATIECYAYGFAARTSLRVGIDIDASVDQLSYESQRSLLRVVQEGLTNIFRHARATEVKIVVEATNGQLRLTISDNGRGFPVRRARDRNSAMSMGVGIPAMRARLRQLGGTLQIRSDPETPHSGTTLCAAFPHRVEAKRRKRRTPLQS